MTETAVVEDIAADGFRTRVEKGKMLGVRKAHSLIGQVFDRRNLESAWKKVRANKGAAGADGVSVDRFDEEADRYLGVLERKLRDKSYRPMPVRRVEIPKGSGGVRRLGIPSVMDRVCQQALKQVLEPVFEPSFSEASYGYRPGRSAHGAIDRVKEHLVDDEYVVDLDLADFFDSIPQEPLIDAVAVKVADGKVLSLIRLFLEAGVLHEDGRRERSFAGTPQGGVISPLLANIYLDHFDKEMGRRGYRLTRYADDAVVACKSRREANRALMDARRLLEGELGLTLNYRKTHTVNIRKGFTFLGFSMFRPRQDWTPEQSGLVVVPSERSIERFEEKVRAITARRRRPKLGDLIAELNGVLRGWGSYYRHANVHSLFRRLNAWVRMRIWSWRRRRWRSYAFKELPVQKLYGELGLVNLLMLVPSMQPYYRRKGHLG